MDDRFSRAIADGDDFDATGCPLDTLIDHIVTRHHLYVRRAMPAIAEHLATLLKVDGGRHPELVRVATIFHDLTAELNRHFVKEEQVLFPYIRDLAQQDNLTPAVSPFGTVANPIRMLEHEHQDAGDAMGSIRELTRGFAVPADGGTTYAATMAELEEFERDLHRHVHLENNVLFPRAFALESGSWNHDHR